METPGWGEEYSEEWDLQGHVFKASLVMEEAMEMMEEDDTLVVEVTVDAWGGEVSLGRGGPTKSHILTKKHVLHKEFATWEEAEEVLQFCTLQCFGYYISDMVSSDLCGQRRTPCLNQFCRGTGINSGIDHGHSWQ